MDVVLAVLPFADVDRPAIGVSLLQAAAARRGFQVSTEYLNIALAERVGLETYNLISESLPTESLVGEWFFADHIFGADIPGEHEYLAKVLARYASQSAIDAIRAARLVVSAFADACIDAILRHRPAVVGFTTTFHQTCACLLIAKRLKALSNPPAIIFGGANCEGEMGLQMIRSFPWIDFVCTREGDEAFPEFLEWLLRDRRRGLPLGILERASNELTLPPIVHDLDSLPLPDYRDYFVRIRSASFHDALKIELPVETARGCWWGALHHCTFCGLNGDTMGFRSKSPQRVIDEFTQLADTYGVRRLNCVDNILDMKYIGTVFPSLRASGRDLELFYEVKANLKLAHLAALKEGGVRVIQPGVESFSDSVLALMEKGCTGAQNLQLLRWCEEVGIAPLWNILAGFPGEDQTEYERMARLVPQLLHLSAPSSCSPIRLDRFSPLFVRRERAGVTRVRPTAAYYYVYPLGRRELSYLASFFDFDYVDGRKPEAYLGCLHKEIGVWLKARAGDPAAWPRLDAYASGPERVTVMDTRPCAVARQHDLHGLQARILVLCDIAKNLATLQRELPEYVAGDIESAVQGLLSRNLLVELSGRYACLPVFRQRLAPSTPEKPHVEARIAQAAPT